MANKNVTPEQVSDILQFGEIASNSVDAEASDGAGSHLRIPKMRTHMVVNVEDIEFYAYNPRQEDNDHFLDIKASIRERGLINLFNITHRPGAYKFSIASGGNTRLRALQELYRETGDEKYGTVTLFFIPWDEIVEASDTGDADETLIIDHLIENENRGDLALIDKALAIARLKKLLEEKTGKRFGSTRLSRFLREHGCPVGTTALKTYAYATTVLEPMIPYALRHGNKDAPLGSPTIRAIRREQNVLRTFWHQQVEKRGWPDTRKEDAEYIFAEAMKMFDHDVFEIQGVFDEVARQFAEILDDPTMNALNIHGVCQNIRDGKQYELASDELLAPPADLTLTPTMDPPGQADQASSDQGKPATVSQGNQRTTSEPADESARGHQVEATSSGNKKPPKSPSDEGAANSRDDQPGLAPLSRPADAKALRGKAYVLAARLAQHNGLGGCVQAMTALNGYRVDFPEKPITLNAQLGEGHRQQWLWWYLVSLSEQMTTPENLALLPEDSHFRQAIEGGLDAVVEARVGEPDWPHVGHQFITNPQILNGDDFRLLCELITVIRQTKDKTQQGDNQ